MALIEPEKKDVQNQIKKYSAPLRLWHWINMIVISGSLITVLINATLNDRANITPLVRENLKNSGVGITDQQAGGVGHALEDKVWAIHTYFGYTLAGLLLFRLVLEFFFK